MHTGRLRFNAEPFLFVRTNSLTLLLGVRLFDQVKLLPRGIPPCLIIGKQMVTAICRGAHQIHGLLAKLIAAQRYVMPEPSDCRSEDVLSGSRHYVLAAGFAARRRISIPYCEGRSGVACVSATP